MNQIHNNPQHGLDSINVGGSKGHQKRKSHGRPWESRRTTINNTYHPSPSQLSINDSYTSKYPLSGLDVFPIRHQRRKNEQDNLQGELPNIKLHIFDGENKYGHDTKT
jgi:hypothetical protein